MWYIDSSNSNILTTHSKDWSFILPLCPTYWKETWAQRGKGTWPRSHSDYEAEPGPTLGPANCHLSRLCPFRSWPGGLCLPSPTMFRQPECSSQRVLHKFMEIDYLQFLKFFLTNLTPFSLLLTLKAMAPPALLSYQGLTHSKCSVNIFPMNIQINRAIWQYPIRMSTHLRPNKTPEIWTHVYHLETCAKMFIAALLVMIRCAKLSKMFMINRTDKL